METDANNSLELVGPPFLIPTVEGIPLPHPGVTEAVDDKIQQSLKGTLQDRSNEEHSYQQKRLNRILNELNAVLGVNFTFNAATEIKTENLSRNINLKALRKLIRNPQGRAPAKLIVTPDNLEDLMIEKSKKVERYEEMLDEEGMNYSHLKHGIAPQLNFATDIPTVALFEKTDQKTLSARERVFIAIEDILKTKFTKPTGTSEEMEYFYTQMIRKLAGLFGVYYQDKTREMQRALYTYVMSDSNEREALADIMRAIKNYSTLTSRLKDTTSVWVKDHLVSIALMFNKQDIGKIITLLKSVEFNAEDFTQLNEIDTGLINKGTSVKFGDYGVYTEGIAPFITLLNTAIKTAREDLREKHDMGKWLRRKMYRGITKSKNRPDSKPKVNELFQHDKTKVGARQDTYLDPKKVQQPGLWPESRLHVGEIREGHIDTLAEAHGKLTKTGDEEKDEE